MIKIHGNRSSLFIVGGSFLIAVACLAACTVLDTTSVGGSKVNETKAQVGRYYLLPKALITIEGQPDKAGKNLLVDASVSLVADSRFRYFLNWKSNPFSEDIINNLDVDSDGMLTSVNYSAEDKTPQILSDLVTTTVNIAKIAKDLGVFGLDQNVQTLPPFTYVFDPFDEAETDRVKGELFTKQHLELQITPGPHGTRSELGRDLNPKVADHPRAGDPKGGGVFYHPPTTVEMLLIDHGLQEAINKAQTIAADERRALAKPTAAPTAKPTAAPTAKPTAAPSAAPKTTPPPPDKTQPIPKPATMCHVVVTVPDVDQVACLRLSRSFLTKRESNLGFAHGMPTTFVFKQPSGVQAFTGTLSSISGIIAAAVPTLINVKTVPSPQKALTPPPASGPNETIPAKVKSSGALASDITDEMPGPSTQSLETTITKLRQNILSQSNQVDEQSAQLDAQKATIMKLRQSLIDSLKAANKTNEEINQVLKGLGLDPIQAE
jgi:hypothetical protein